ADGGGEVLVAGGDDDLGGGPGRGCPVGGGHGPGDEVQERVGSAPRGGSGVAGAVGAGAGFGQGGQGGVDGRGALGVQDQAVLGAAAGPGMEVRDRAARARSASWSRSAADLTSRPVRVIAALSSRSVSPRQRTGSPCSSRWSRPVSSKTESRAPSTRVWNAVSRLTGSATGAAWVWNRIRASALVGDSSPVSRWETRSCRSGSAWAAAMRMVLAAC